VLASASGIRRRLLENAGIDFSVIPANVDETIIRRTLLANDNVPDPVDVAEILARAKVQDVALRDRDKVIIAADQVLSFDGKIFEKPRDFNEARADLLAFSGHTHSLHSAVVLAMQGEIVWSHTDTVRITMRRLSPDFVKRYLENAGPKVFTSVGCYEIEGTGIHLIEDIEGDYFTALGLPLLALMDALRRNDIIEQ